MAEFNPIYMIIGISVVFAVLLFFLLWHQIKETRQKKKQEEESYGGLSIFKSESKTDMITQIEKRESQIRREQILEGGTMPELSEIVIYSPFNNDKISTPEVDVRGKTALKSIVWVNNYAAFVDVDGSFIGTVPLNQGKNDIKIVAIGPYGNSLSTSVTVRCTAKETSESVDLISPLPSIEIEERTPETEPRSQYQSYSEAIKSESTTPTKTQRRRLFGPSSKPSEPSRPTKQGTFKTKMGDPAIVPESEIDPSVLSALRGEEVSEKIKAETAEEMESVPIDTIEPEEPSIPPIPDVDKEEEIGEEEPVQLDQDDEDIEESVKIIEEVIEEEEEEEIVKDEDNFPLDDMMPVMSKGKAYEKHPAKAKKIPEEDLSEFEKLEEELPETIDLNVKFNLEELEDERDTKILQYSGLLEREDGELVKILKAEKRIEKINDAWHSTIGIANNSDKTLEFVEINEFISDTMELSEKLPPDVVDPIIDQLPEGTKITWRINQLAPQKKIFISYTEKVNPLKVISEDQRKPNIKVRK